MDSRILKALPLAPRREPFLEALARGPVVLAAPTGSGKSTLVPLWCAEATGPALVVEPRRVACRALYRFLRQESGAPVGYAVRHEQQHVRGASVLFVTPGVALRLMAEGRLRDFGCVVLDEFHERRLDGDLILAHLKERAARTVVMSATLQVDRVAEWLGAARLQAEGRTFPVEVEHAGGEELPSSRNLAARVVDGVSRALAVTGEGDVLVFLPGKGEIRDAAQALRGRCEATVLELHAQLPRDRQDRVFEPPTGRRIILATNVAETSLTIPWVRAVVDSGLERRTSYRRARSVLSLSAVSASSATQRAGRAGRVAPGVAIRLWSERGILRPDTPPEILREDLDPLLLSAGALGLRVEALDFLDPPDPDAVTAARERLVAMGLSAAGGALTELGREAARFPLDPLLARLVLQASSQDDPALLEDMVDLVASLAHGAPPFEGRAPRPTSPGQRGRRHEPQAPAAPGHELASAGCDAAARILALRIGHPERHGLRPYALREGRRIATQLRRQLGLAEASQRTEIQRLELAAAVVRAYPPAAFVKRRQRFACPGLEVELGAASFASEESEALVVLETRSLRTRGMRATHQATCAMPVTRLWLAEQGLGEEEVTRVDLEAGAVVGQVERRLCNVTLASRRVPLSGPLLLDGAARLIARGTLLKGLMAELEPRLELTASWYALRRETPPAPLSAHGWLVHRLDRLGVTDGDDLALLSPADLYPDLVEAAELEDFAARFPARLQLQDRRCRVEYDFAGRRAELVHADGNDRHPPSRATLPVRWPGWEVTYRIHSRRWKLD